MVVHPLQQTNYTTFLRSMPLFTHCKVSQAHCVVDGFQVVLFEDQIGIVIIVGTLCQPREMYCTNKILDGWNCKIARVTSRYALSLS